VGAWKSLLAAAAIRQSSSGRGAIVTQSVENKTPLRYRDADVAPPSLLTVTHVARLPESFIFKSWRDVSDFQK